MARVEVTTVQALLGFPDLRAAIVGGWHRGEPTSELLVRTQIAAARDAISEAIPAGWALVGNAVVAPAEDARAGQVSVADLRRRLAHLPEVLAGVGVAEQSRREHWRPWMVRRESGPDAGRQTARGVRKEARHLASGPVEQ